MGSLARYSERGTSLLEVLITIVILVIGLLGLAGLQSRLQVSEMESYQRAQALILLTDMANRITANRLYAASYVTGSDNPLGEGMTCPTTSSTQQEIDTAEWCNALKGAAETVSGSNVGAMIGGRGCVEDLGSGQYMITVAWQGLAPIATPPSSVGCGKDLYNGGTGSNCTGDACRRFVTTIVRIATLT
jgi:type IV pilus assembly protein PilV